MLRTDSSHHLLTYLILSALLASTVRAADFLPLEQGNFWTYGNVQQEFETRRVTGHEEIMGSETVVITYTDSPDNQGLRNFWSVGPNGEVICHGYSRPEGGVVYDPPITHFDPSVPVGGSWTEPVRGYLYPDGPLVIAGELTYTVHESGVCEVPAGTFVATGFGSHFVGDRPGVVPDHDLMGQAGTADGPLVQYWMSQGVGEILLQYPGDQWSLTDYQAGPVATESRGLGAVKALFR